MPHLTKSKFIAGLKCSRRLWFAVHDPLPYVDAPPGSAMDVGNRVGRGAHRLFPSGVEVTEAPWAHDAAVARTRDLMADASVPAIFEAAFEFEGVRIRVDVLERLSGGTWGLREVKSSLSVKAESYHHEDAAIQLHVLAGCGLAVASVELIHTNRDYVRGAGEIDWPAILVREDITEACRELLPGLRAELAAQWHVLDAAEPPEVRPFKSRCNGGYTCDFWERCTAAKPADWIQYLPHVRLPALEELTDAGIERIIDIPDDYRLNGNQARMRDVLRSGRPYVSPDLGRALHNCGPPAYYLDFEFMSPILPAYAETSPNQEIVFQYSLRHADADGRLTHREFLAAADRDPRRELAERLVADIADDGAPVIAYNAGTEAGVIRRLAAAFPDLAPPLEAINARMLDLLPVVRGHTYFEEYQGSFSLKAVGPTLVPELSYDALDGVDVGTDAAIAFWLMAIGDVTDAAEVEGLRRQLLEYCKLDTLLLAEVHRRLMQLAA